MDVLGAGTGVLSSSGPGSADLASTTKGSSWAGSLACCIVIGSRVSTCPATTWASATWRGMKPEAPATSRYSPARSDENLNSPDASVTVKSLVDGMTTCTPRAGLPSGLRRRPRIDPSCATWTTTNLPLPFRFGANPVPARSRLSASSGSSRPVTADDVVPCSSSNENSSSTLACLQNAISAASAGWAGRLNSSGSAGSDAGTREAIPSSRSRALAEIARFFGERVLVNKNRRLRARWAGSPARSRRRRAQPSDRAPPSGSPGTRRACRGSTGPPRASPRRPPSRS